MMMAWTFLGLGAAVLLPLASGLLLATVALYLLRLRRRPLVVPFLQLWEQQLGQKSASRLRSQLKRLLSLLLQLCLLGLLLLALADPRRDSYALPEKSVVVLIDTSASMSANGTTERGTLLDDARAAARERLAQRGPRDEVLLVELNAQPSALGPWTRETRDLEGALDSLQPKHEAADLSAALRVAEDALAQRAHAQIWIFSDGALPPLPKERKLSAHLGKHITLISVAPPGVFGSPKDAPVARNVNSVNIAPTPEGLPRENVGISAFAARRYPLDPDGFEVLLEVANTGTTTAEVEVSLERPNAAFGPGELVDVLRLSVPPGERHAKTISDLSSIEHGLIGRVRRVDGGGNWLVSDDTARALLPHRPPLRLLIVGGENTFLDAALLTDPSLIVTRCSPEAYPPPGDFDVVLFDQTFPQRVAATGPALYLGAPAPSDSSSQSAKGKTSRAPAAATPEVFSPLTASSELHLFGFDNWDEKSRLLRFIDPYDVQVLTGWGLVARPEDHVHGKSGQTPILVSGVRPEGRFVQLGFDPRQSDFVLRAAFPLFISNALDVLAPAALREATPSLATGTTTTLNAESPSGRVVFEGPLGSPQSHSLTLLESAGSVALRPRWAGFYRLKEEKGESIVAANYFDEAEATLVPQAGLMLSGQELAWSAPNEAAEEPSTPLAALESQLSLRAPLEPWMLIVLVVSLLLFVEWWTYHRRLTV